MIIQMSAIKLYRLACFVEKSQVKNIENMGEPLACIGFKEIGGQVFACGTDGFSALIIHLPELDECPPYQIYLTSETVKKLKLKKAEHVFINMEGVLAIYDDKKVPLYITPYDVRKYLVYCDFERFIQYFSPDAVSNIPLSPSMIEPINAAFGPRAFQTYFTGEKSPIFMMNDRFPDYLIVFMPATFGDEYEHSPNDNQIINHVKDHSALFNAA